MQNANFLFGSNCSAWTNSRVGVPQKKKVASSWRWSFDFDFGFKIYSFQLSRHCPQELSRIMLRSSHIRKKGSQTFICWQCSAKIYSGFVYRRQPNGAKPHSQTLSLRRVPQQSLIKNDARHFNTNPIVCYFQIVVGTRLTWTLRNMLQRKFSPTVHLVTNFRQLTDLRHKRV